MPVNFRLFTRRPKLARIDKLAIKDGWIDSELSESLSLDANQHQIISSLGIHPVHSK